MKSLVIALIALSLCSCVNDYAVERHELRFISANIVERVVYMNDLTSGDTVAIRYSYELFRIEFIELCQINGSPLFVFLYSNGCYYRL